MIKHFFFLRRLPYLTREDLHNYWLDFHIQYDSKLQHVRRFTLYNALAPDAAPALPGTTQGTDNDFDMIHLLDWDGLQVMTEEISSSPIVAPAWASVQRTIDIHRSIICLLEESVVVEPEGKAPFVLVTGLRRRKELSESAFRDQWSKHAAFYTDAHKRGLISGHIQNNLLPEVGHFTFGEFGAKAEPWDGISLTYFDAVGQFKIFAADPAVRAALTAQSEFVDAARSTHFLARRHAIKQPVR